MSPEDRAVIVGYILHKVRTRPAGQSRMDAKVAAEIELIKLHCRIHRERLQPA